MQGSLGRRSGRRLDRVVDADRFGRKGAQADRNPFGKCGQPDRIGERRHADTHHVGGRGQEGPERVQLIRVGLGVPAAIVGEIAAGLALRGKG